MVSTKKMSLKCKPQQTLTHFTQELPQSHNSKDIRDTNLFKMKNGLPHIF